MDNPINTARQSKGFLSSEETVSKLGVNNVVLDPHSVLISGSVGIGHSNVFYPNVVIENRGDHVLEIGDNNVFYPGTYILNSEGTTKIGNDNEFGPGGCIIKANAPGTDVKIGNKGRYCDGPTIVGNTHLGDGSQVIGAITVINCSLAAGTSYEDDDPDKRGAVLKGFGTARGLNLKTGEVVNGQGNFNLAAVELQSSYHPSKR